RPLLPSVRYHAAAGELDAGDLQLPWTATVTATATATAKRAASGGHGADRGDGKAAQSPVVIGRLARTLGGQVPGRLVASAKSW
ncbi:hypothetical protein SB861_65575, partial [Paraburkholderia sp. SIMBA_049]